MIISKNIFRFLVAMCLLLKFGVVCANNLFSDETDQRRVGISMSIFPRIVAVDNHFRSKLGEDEKAHLLFVYDKEEDFAQELADRMQEESKNIGGKYVETSIQKVSADYSSIEVPTAIFIVEKLSDEQINNLMAYAEKYSRLVFSPYHGDVERGVMVGISVTNRVKPYFNLQALRRSKVVINALLMKMSKRYE